MVTQEKLIKIIELNFPLETQENWDNSGWQIKLKQKEIKKVLLCISITAEIIEQAIKEKCELIISHHPIFFNSIKNIQDEKIIKLIQNNISLYSTHTCFDKALTGTTQTLAKFLHVENIENINEYTIKADLENAKTLKDFITEMKKIFKISSLKVFNAKENKKIKKITICAGSGSEFIKEVKNKSDIFITADVKYHDALEAANLIIIDMGHFESEKPALKELKKLIEKEVEVIEGNEKQIWQIL